MLSNRPRLMYLLSGVSVGFITFLALRGVSIIIVLDQRSIEILVTGLLGALFMVAITLMTVGQFWHRR